MGAREELGAAPDGALAGDHAPVAVASACHRRLQRRDAAMPLAKRRERGMLAPLEGGIDVLEQVAERLAVALAVARRVAGHRPGRRGVRVRVLDDDLLRT